MAGGRDGGRDLPGIGRVTFQTVGNTAHTTALEARGEGWLLQFALALDDAMRPELVPCHARTWGGGRVPGDLTGLAAAGRECLSGDPVGSVFLAMGRADMDARVLGREAGDRRPGPMREALEGRAADLVAAGKALRAWCSAPAKTRESLPALAGARDGSVPLEARKEADGAAATREALALALSDPEATASFSAPILPSQAAGVARAAAAGLGLREVAYLSCRNDPFGDGHKAIVPGAPRPMAPHGLSWMVSEGRVGSSDLLLVELVPPSDARLDDILARLAREGIDPVVLAFDTATVHVGRASALASALERARAPQATPTPA